MLFTVVLRTVTINMRKALVRNSFFFFLKQVERHFYIVLQLWVNTFYFAQHREMCHNYHLR